ncbi:ABC transporter permease/M1 family aminopeptidase [Sphingosinicella rhizophila]|uniref:M1 family aminopeptidase n=1 Tax=Sphingosinicella rhizophila TaxID=3050082 RepID=A0ABU3Q697_9SPHN|nr:M1 family aminopeptidase [Sphingosinicella sp. GR2756]MDT9598832.1 M1 family aminopeptidase [Sphingosinicella sp. GR2756]
MFATIARFELRYQLRNPVFWVAAIMFFLLTFAGTTVESIRLGSGGNIHTNAPTAVAQIQLMMSIFFMFVTTAFVGNVVVRDDETGFGSIIRSTKVGKFPYMIGRFSGAFLGAAVAFLAVPLATWIGTYMPWVDPEHLGPNQLRDYAYGYLVLALPNIFITSAVFFAVASWTRSVTYSYLTVIVFMFAYFALTSALRKLPDLTMAAYFEPFGTVAYGVAIRYLSPVQANSQAVELTGLLLGNRLLWVAVSAAIVAIAVWRFRFAERGASGRKAKRQLAREKKLARIEPVLVERLPDNRPGQAAWRQLVVRTLLEMKLVFKSPAFWVLAIVGTINLYLTLNLAGLFYGVPIWPRTFAIVETVTGASAMITLLIVIYFSGEIVWRERERRINEIVDATPLPNWILLVSKLAGVAGVLLVLGVAVIMVESILYQLMGGVKDIELGRWLAWFVAPSILYVIQLSVLSIVVQALSPNKFVGWGIMLLYLISGIVFASIGLGHPLLNYAAVAMPLSDMNGSNYGGAVGWWLRFYWLAFALLLVVIGHLMWRRGTAVTLKGQWRSLPARLRGKPLAFLAVALTLTVGMGSFLFYNMNVLNQYPDRDEAERRLARYEQLYSRYVDLPQPTLTDVRMKVDLYPSRGAMYVDGTYRFANRTSAPIETLHIRMIPGLPTPLRVESVAGAKLVQADKENNHFIYRFDRPLLPGASGTVSFRTAVEKQGLAALPDSQNYEVDAQPAANGTYIINHQILPILGMSRLGFLDDKRKREQYGLSPAPEAPKLQDRSAQAKNYAGLERVNTDITVTTDADQTLVATGARVSDTVVDGRRIARFVSPIPSINFIMIQSARYAVKRANSDGVKLEVYYHPEHPKNIDRMLSVMDDALDYFRTNFGPYQYPYARIIERPSYGGGANSAAGTIGFSEKVGFNMDLSNPKRLDFLAYITTHELAHQYWFHQLMPADMEGAELLTEGLAQYSALMVMKHRYGPDQIRQFLKYELDQYLQGRRLEKGEENPLGRTRDQGYIHYNKASIVMYLIQERLGEERVNAVLRELLSKYRFKPAPYARSSDLIDGLLAVARTPQERELILDQFYRITLYDLRMKEANVRRLPNGQFETTMIIAAAKTHADRKGNEREAKFDQQVDVGLFTALPGDLGFGRENVLSMQRLPLRSGEQQVRLVTQNRPAYAGVDPYLTFIDRNSNDNIVQISELGQ